MTQQMLADRIGKSKSWVDKVERGVRSLDKLSVIQDIAEALRIEPTLLLDRSVSAAAGMGTADAAEELRAVLARYEVFGSGVDDQTLPSVDELDRRARHALLSYRHAQYPQLLRSLPALLTAAQRVHSRRPPRGAALLAQVYRMTSAVLVKVGEADLGWLAADRALAVTAGDPLLAAEAAVELGQALRALRRGRLAMAVTAAASQVALCGSRGVALSGTLRLQSALAAATCGDERDAERLLGEADKLAEQLGDVSDSYRTNTFGPIVVELVQVVVTSELGDARQAVRRHEHVVQRERWRVLPPEHRAAYLIDVAEAYLKAGDMLGAGRVLVEAYQIAPAEIRMRPAARTAITTLARAGRLPVGLGRIADAMA